MKNKLLQLDGSSGGGQMLRTALSLSAITGQGFAMSHIRGKRPRPGLMRQHLTCVQATAEVCGATVEGAEIGATEITFRPGSIRAGNYHFSIGTAGSTALLFQTLLPVLWSADGPSELRLEGGTHNPMAPPYEFLDEVFLPAIGLAGVSCDLELGSAGFIPVGGGELRARIAPCPRLLPLDFTARQSYDRPAMRLVYRNLPQGILDRTIAGAREIFPEIEASVTAAAPGPSTGLCALVSVKGSGLPEMSSCCGDRGIMAEQVGRRAAKPLCDFLGATAPVGRHLADQLLLPMALAGGGAFLTMKPDDHVTTNISVIEQFLPVSFQIHERERRNTWIEVS
jgi:RNA 3'-terminal phosphate cyclase (ATP)